MKGRYPASAFFVLAVLTTSAAAIGLAPSEEGLRVAFDLSVRSPVPGLARAVFTAPASAPPASLIKAANGALPEAVKPDLARRKRLRAWTELGSFTIVSTVRYWLGNSFPEDRDFLIDFDSQISRVLFFDGWRFDSNQFSLNWSHALAGGLYYQFGRANFQSWVDSWLMALAASTWWEILGEPKEVIAINDEIMTGLGGLALGEPWYQIGHFLCHQPGPVFRGLGFLNPAVKLNHWMDRRDPTAEDYVAPGWHEMKLFLGARRLSSSGRAAGTDLYFGIEARLVGPPEYGRPGEVRRIVAQAFGNEIRLDYSMRGGRVEETRLSTRTVTFGRFVQKIGPSGAGSGLFLGFGSAFELFKKRPVAPYDVHPVPVKTDWGPLLLETPRAFTDKLAILHVAGPVLDWTVFRRDLKLRAFVEAYLDFALVNSYALNDYSRSHDIVGLKTTVFYYGYYYGFGGSAAAGARFDWKGIRVRGQVHMGGWGSADFLDRFEGDVTNNAHLGDTRLRYLAGAGWRIPGTAFELFFDVEGVRRRGSLAGVVAKNLETKTYAGLAFVF